MRAGGTAGGRRRSTVAVGLTRRAAIPTRGIASLSQDGTRGSIVLCPPGNHPIGDDRSPNGTQSERFRLIVDARDHARTRLGPFDPEQLSASEPLTLPIERGRLVVGSVRDESGAPIPGARVHEIGPGPGRACNMFTWQVCTAIRALGDRDGAFSIGPVAAASAICRRRDRLPSRRSSRHGGRESDGALVVCVLGRGATVRGAVTSRPTRSRSFEVVLQRRGAPVPGAGIPPARPTTRGDTRSGAAAG